MLEYSNYVQVCDSVMPSNTSKREGLVWFYSTAIPQAMMGSEGSGAVLWGQAGPGLGLPAWHGVGPAAFSSFFYDMHYIYTSESKKKIKNKKLLHRDGNRGHTKSH